MSPARRSVREVDVAVVRVVLAEGIVRDAEGPLPRRGALVGAVDEFGAEGHLHERVEALRRRPVAPEDLRDAEDDGELEVEAVGFVGLLDELLEGKGRVDALGDLAEVLEDVVELLAPSEADAGVPVPT